MGSEMSMDASCYGCIHGIGRKSTWLPRRRKEKAEKEPPKEPPKEPRKPSKPEPPTPTEGRRRRCGWFCCRRKAPVASCGTYSCEDGISCPTLDGMDATQRAILADLRGRLADLKLPKRHDLWLKRFLAHKKWNLEKALAAYVEMEEWRCSVGADDILQECPDGNLNPVLPVDMTGFYPYSVDKKGRMVIWMSTGHVPWWRSLFERTDEALRAQLWQGEWIYAQQAELAKITGVWHERAVVLVDLSHLDFNYFQGLSGCSRARRRGTAQTTAQYYPGVVDKAYLLHAPSFASRAWSILKFFLSEKLMEKAMMVSSETELQHMLEDLGAANVPRSLGGSSDRPDLQLPSVLMMPRDGWRRVLESWKPQEICIAAGAQHEERLVIEAGSFVSWQWALVGSSVTFTVKQKDLENEVDVVGPMECHFHDLEEPIFGSLTASVGPTEYRFLWDNTASHWSKRTLLLRLEVSTSSRRGDSPC